MCGIAGVLSFGDNAAPTEQVVRAMVDPIRHRGPDDLGLWFDEGSKLGLGHRRLSIIDLTTAGHQPMLSASGRYVIVYNGEIYNQPELVSAIEDVMPAPNWRGRSDTEALLMAFDVWGISNTLPKINGMFAFAVWDQCEKRLTIARDRIGEKPLFYGTSNGHFLFGSELRAITSHPAFSSTVDKDALSLFLRYSYVPSPHCIWKGVKKLLPGSYVEIDPSTRHVSDPILYWDLAKVAEKGMGSCRDDSPELADELEILLKDSIHRQMTSDVPVGTFLSGGIDSSLITALMQSNSKRSIETFTIGFADQNYDESGYARAVSEHLGTRHRELRVTANEALEVVPQLSSTWDEPFADSSQIPTLLVSNLARQYVTVSLSGDGGDELFAGYNRYIAGWNLWNSVEGVPEDLRRMAAWILNRTEVQKFADLAMGMVPSRHRQLGLGDRLSRVATIISSRSRREAYGGLVSIQNLPAELTLDPSEIDVEGQKPSTQFDDFRQEMMFMDTMAYLPDDILVKLDRASMAVSLESRVPFLDHRVVEFAWTIPMSAKVRDGRGKAILRTILSKYVPEELTARPKMGFAIPIGDWLRGGLRSWAESHLSEERLRRDGFFKPTQVRRLWAEHINGRRNHQTALWNILMFQAWWAETGSSVASGDTQTA
jgi:asparagine synthase (glutamine-hydrolysing)